MKDDIQEILLTEEQIYDKAKELGEKISNDYKGKDLILVGILKGAVIFASDLIKNITIPCKIDFMAVSSYGNSTKSSGEVKILKDLDYSIENKDILIVEDIVDTGVTLNYLAKNFEDRRAKSVNIVTLLDKPEGRKVKVNVKYVGFEIPNKFLVGYGLDYNEYYRNLPLIGILKPEIYEK